MAKKCEIADKKNLLDRFRRRIESVSSLNDEWHAWVEQSIFCKTNDRKLQAWGNEILLPLYYFEGQLKKSKRNKQLKSYYQELVKKAKIMLDKHSLTKEHLNGNSECYEICF